DEHRRIAGVVQRESRKVHVCATRKFWSGAHLSDGLTVSPWGQESKGSSRWLDKDLVFSETVERLHRILSLWDNGNYEGIRRGLARHYCLNHGLGYQSSRPWHRS